MLQELHQVPELDFLPICQSRSASPLYKIAEQRGVGSLCLLGLSTLIANMLQKVFDQVLQAELS
jgi:hypothetical protein